MTNLELTGDAGMMSPIALFMQADLIVKSVMIGLILASIWTWAIIIGHAFRLKKVGRENARFEKDFWAADDIDKFNTTRGRDPWPSAKIFTAGIDEWRRSTAGKAIDKDGTRSRLAMAMHAAVG